MKSIFGTIFSKIIGLFSIIFFTPIFFKSLTPVDFSVYSLMGTIIALLTVLDLGISGAIPMIIGASEKGGIIEGIKKYETTYFFIGITSASLLLIIILTVSIPVDSVISRINQDFYLTVLLLFTCISQVFSGFYIACYIGCNRLIESNKYLIIFTIIKYSSYYAAIIFEKNILISVLVLTLLINIIQILVMRARLLGINQKLSLNLLVSIRLIIINKKLFLSFFGLGLISFCMSQWDKIFLSVNANPVDFSIYTAIYAFSMLPILILSPVATAILPYLIRENEVNHERYIFVISLIIRFIGYTISIYGIFFSIYFNQIVSRWIPGVEINSNIYFIFYFLVIANLIQAYSLVPYYIGLSKGMHKYLLILNLFTLIFFICLGYYMYNKLSIIGLACAWMLSNLLFTFAMIIKVLQRVNIKLHYFRDPFNYAIIMIIIFFMLIKKFIENEINANYLFFAYIILFLLMVYKNKNDIFKILRIIDN